MNRRLFGAFGVLTVIALSVGSCKSDPLSDADGNPAAVVTNFSYLQMPIGTTAAITATVLDARTTPLDVPITFTPCTADVTVAEDTSYHPIPHTSERAIVTAVSAAPTCVRVSSGGVEDTVSVAVLPAGFTAVYSSTTPEGGDTITIGATSLLKFTAASTVTFGGGIPGTTIASTPDLLTVLVPFSNAGAPTISGVNVSYVPGLVVTLPTTTTVTQTGALRATSGSYQTAMDFSALVPPAPGTGAAIVELPTGNAAVCPEVVTDNGSSGPCAIYKFTIADTTTLRVRVDWNGTALAPDIDLMVCSDTTLATFNPNTLAPCNAAGLAGATNVKPQQTAFTKLAPRTYWIVIENYAGTVSRNHYLSIIRQ